MVSAAPGLPIPALLRRARASYSRAIRERLVEAGCDDLPRNGAFVVGGMQHRGGSAGDLIHDLGVSKQAASQLVDVLVLRGYLVRRPHPEDRRRLVLELTDRGEVAALAVQAGIEAVDEELERVLGPEGLASLRAGLEALAAVAGRHEDGEGGS